MKRILSLVFLIVALCGYTVSAEGAPVRGGGMRSGAGGGAPHSMGIRGGGAAGGHVGSWRGGGAAGGHVGSWRGGGGHGGGWHGRGHGGGNFHSSVIIGAGFWDPWWGYPYPYAYPYPYYSPSPVIVEQRPQEYIYQEAQPQSESYWYFCNKPEGYYPYVKRCPGGWLKVVPPSAPADEEEVE